MSDLTPEDEVLLARARRGGEASVADRARVKRKVFARIGIGVGVSAISTAGGASAGLAAGGAGGVSLAISSVEIFLPSARSMTRIRWLLVSATYNLPPATDRPAGSSSAIAPSAAALPPPAMVLIVSPLRSISLTLSL